MVAVNFDRARPPAMLNLNEVAELARLVARERLAPARRRADLHRGDGAELAELLPALAEASRTVGSPQIRNRGTIGGNLATASPAGDALPPLVIEDAEVECASVRGTRRVPIADFVTGVKRNALAPDELITAVWLDAVGGAADVHEGRAAERDGDRGRLARAQRAATSCARRSARPSPRPVLVTAPRDEADSFPERVAAAAAPIDDVRGTAAYRRHALRVMTKRALERTLA